MTVPGSVRQAAASAGQAARRPGQAAAGASLAPTRLAWLCTAGGGMLTSSLEWVWAAPGFLEHFRVSEPVGAARRGVLTSQAEVEAEGVLAGRILGHLVRKQAVLLAVDEPARREGEADGDFARRVQAERVLAVNPNFALE